LTPEVPNAAPADLVLDADPTVTVGHVARWLAVRQGVDPDLAISIGVRRPDGMTALLPDGLVADSALRSGDVVSLIEAPTSAPSTTAEVSVRVVAGPDTGFHVRLPAGHVDIGRDPSCGIRLTDPLVSQRHARLLVSDRVEILDHGSSNGTLVAGDYVSRAVVENGSEIVVGATTLLVHVEGGGWSSARSGAEPYNRSPWLDPRYAGVKLKAPEPPQPPQPERFPWIMLAGPIVMAIVLYFVTHNLASLAFIALSPLLMVGGLMQSRSSAKRAWETAVQGFHDSMADLVQQMQRAMEHEQHGRRHEHPSVEETVNAGLSRHPMLWCRRPDQPSFLDVRLGLGTVASRNEIETPTTRNTTPELWKELTDVTSRFSTVERVPVVGALTEVGAIGVAGADPARIDAARGLVTQLATLHSPAELAIAAIIPSLAKPDWEWLKWLPHVDSDHSPIAADQLASSGPAASAVVAALLDLVDERADSGAEGPARVPAVVVVIDEDAPYERARLVDLAERGPACGVYTLWLGRDRTRLPAVCRAFLEIDPATMQPGTGMVTDGSYVAPVEVGFLNAAGAMAFARSLAPVVDAGALLDEAADLPRTVSFASEQGPELLGDPGAVLDRWRLSGSISSEATDDRRVERSLRAFVGVAAGGPLMLDLRTHGPHALVGGTTGSGKSEFLQSWLLGMAIGHSPERVNFLLVDYKGGAAFGECANLPHAVGLVTDLNTRLVRRALTSLRAELTRREHVLQAWRAKDLVDLESKERDGAPIVPSLIIVVDEFAALVQEIPDFVDGMIDIAQRGRSLGLHLVLATQRPSGVIKGNLRANTNLRVALRVADEEDSEDVVGSRIAASFDPDTPGRAVAKLGPGKLVPFQAGYVGGWTTGRPPAPTLNVSAFPFGRGRAWDAPPAIERGARDLGPKDLQRLCGSIDGAFERARMERPMRPWLPELAARYELSRLPTKRLDSELVFAVTDDPQRQSQDPAAFEPDRDGNLLAVGASGSGRTTFLRTMAVAAGLAVKGGPCVVYGIDAAGRGLGMLETLPHVGSIIAGDDDERIKRLLRQLRYTIDERMQAFAAVTAGTIVEYRTLAGRPDEPRVLLLVDGLPSLIATYDTIAGQKTLDQLESIIQDGRAVGIHVIATVDRLASIRPAVLSSFPARLALRLNDEMDLMAADLPKDSFEETSPAGRGYFKGQEVQVALLSGAETSVASQAEAIAALARSMERTGRVAVPEIQRLPTLVRLADLPAVADGAAVFGLSDETLGPIGIRPDGLIVVTGPVGSGRTTALDALTHAMHRAFPTVRAAYLGVRRSGVSAPVAWSRSAIGDDVARLADELANDLDAGTAPERLIVIESLGDLAGEAEYELQRLVRAVRSAGACALIEGELALMSQSYGLAKDARASRQAIVLQPDAGDFEVMSGFPSGRLDPASCPPGRGFLCLPGGVVRVQVAMP
jgi:S-DNA-T family DNA segregation ATPase FtsK/SpoIIIE